MKRYVGNASGTSDAHTIEVWEAEEIPDGVAFNLLGLLTHHPKHSPTGMSWGYGGSGPADCARSLLIDHLGDNAWCTACSGTGRPYPSTEEEDGSYRIGRCFSCWGEKTSFTPSLYQAFKFDVIAGLPQHGRWELTSDQIDQWLATRTEATS